MKDFLLAALPWVVIGICVALLAVNSAKRRKGRKAADDDVEPKRGDHMEEGMCIGMCIGVAFGTSKVVDLATGISLGMLLGMVVGMNIKK